jgi:hypothetical protein
MQHYRHCSGGRTKRRRYRAKYRVMYRVEYIVKYRVARGCYTGCKLQARKKEIKVRGWQGEKVVVVVVKQWKRRRRMTTTWEKLWTWQPSSKKGGRGELLGPMMVVLGPEYKPQVSQKKAYMAAASVPQVYRGPSLVMRASAGW